MKIVAAGVLAAALLTIGGCGHGPLNQFHDQETTAGRQTLIGELARDYAASFTEGAAAVEQWYRTSGATLEEKRFTPDGSRAVLDGRLPSGTEVRWTVTADSSTVITIAVLYDEADLSGAARALDAMEKGLNAKRVAAPAGVAR